MSIELHFELHAGRTKGQTREGGVLQPHHPAQWVPAPFCATLFLALVDSTTGSHGYAFIALIEMQGNWDDCEQECEERCYEVGWNSHFWTCPDRIKAERQRQMELRMRQQQKIFHSISFLYVSWL